MTSPLPEPTDTPLVSVGNDGAARILLAAPVRCPGCGRMVMLVVNRGGRTRCVECDAAEVAKEK